MKVWICLTIAICLVLFAVVVQSDPVDVIFTWEPNTEMDLAGYNLYQSEEEGVYVFEPGCEVVSVTADSLECVLSVDSSNTYYWVLTAYDKWGNESGPSNEVSNDKTAPAAPGGFSCR